MVDITVKEAKIPSQIVGSEDRNLLDSHGVGFAAKYVEFARE